MARRFSVLLIAFLAFVLIAEDCAFGFPPWRRRRYYGGGGGGGPVQVAMKNPAALSEYPEVSAFYNYNRARDEEVAFADRIRMFVEIHDAELLASSEPLVAEVRLTDLGNSEHDRIVFVPVALEAIEDSESKRGVFEIANVKAPTQSGAVQKGAEQKDASQTSTQKEPLSAENSATQKTDAKVADVAPIIAPESVYRAFVVLHRRAPKYDTKSAWGRIRGPYYVATSGDSQLAKARHHIVMRTFKEFYYTERGWQRDENSPLDCHAYYRWATGSCTKGSSYGYANIEWLFDRYHGGGEVAGLAEKEAIHADYVRIPGHTFMLLDYDKHLNQVWTMESNFNYTVEVAIRPPGSSWTVGHLDASHILEEMFQPEEPEGTVEEATANSEVPELTTAEASETTMVR